MRQALPFFTFVTAAVVSARPSARAADCCALIADVYPDKIATSGSSDYATESQSYWSSTCSAPTIAPECYFIPDTVDEVAAAVKIITENECKFSVRGGGHHSTPRAANNEGGVTIAMTKFKANDIDPVNNIVSSGPGNRLVEIYAATDPYDKVAVLGRYAQVGTGLLLGAGLSYLNNPYGLSIDNVVAHQVVLANGTVVMASADENPDLHKALKGGGNNFGVVTRYDLRLFDRPHNVLGGLVTYGEEAMPFYDDLTYDYHVDAAVNDKATHILPQWAYNGATKLRESFTPFYYAVDQPNLPPTLQPWIEVPFVKSTIRNTTELAPLAFENFDGYSNGDAQEQRTITIYADRDFFHEVSARFYEFAKQWDHIEGFYALHCKMPITAFMVEKGVENGGNVLGLDGLDRSVSTLYFGVTTKNVEDTPELFAAHDAFVEELAALAAERDLLHRYIMWNYSGYNQKVLASYGEDSVAFMKDVSQRYDPTGAFQRLMGGQKIPE